MTYLNIRNQRELIAQGIIPEKEDESYLVKFKRNSKYKDFGLYNETMLKALNLNDEEAENFKVIGWASKPKSSNRFFIYEDQNNKISEENLNLLIQ